MLDIDNDDESPLLNSNDLPPAFIELLAFNDARSLRKNLRLGDVRTALQFADLILGRVHYTDRLSPTEATRQSYFLILTDYPHFNHIAFHVITTFYAEHARNARYYATNISSQNPSLRECVDHFLKQIKNKG